MYSKVLNKDVDIAKIIGRIIIFLVFTLGSAITVASSGLLTDSYAVAPTSSIDITVNLASAISIRTLDKDAISDIEQLDLELIPSVTGRFIKNTTNVDVVTSNPTGYTLYMTSDQETREVPPTYTTSMLHESSDVDYTIPTISPTTGNSITEAQFSVANSDYRNNWGYSLTGYDTAGTYKAIPAHDTSDIIRNDVKTATDYSLTPVTIGVNVDTGVASGIYSNKLVFSTIVNPPYVDYRLDFNANTDGSGGDDGIVANLPSNIVERIMATSHTVTIPDTIPERAGYKFKNWNTNPDGSGDTYSPGDNFTLMVEDAPSMDVENSSATLYAMWSNVYSVTYDCDGGSGCPDDFSITTDAKLYNYIIPTTSPSKALSIFNGYTGSDGLNYNQNSTITLSESGSHEVELKAQWKAYNFWTVPTMQEMTSTMCDALYLPSAAMDTNVTIINNEAIYNATVKADNQAYVPERTIPDSRDGNTYTVRKLADGNCWMTSNLRLGKAGQNIVLTPADSNVGSNITIPASRVVASPNGSWSADQWNVYVSGNTNYGNYYGWYTAVVGSGNSGTTSGNSASYSICPKNWKLPTGGPSSEIMTLTTKYGFPSSKVTGNTSWVNKLQQSPLNFVKSGGYWNALYAQNENGAIWSRTAGNVTANAYNLGWLGRGEFIPANTNPKYGGWPVRCLIAR